MNKETDWGFKPRPTTPDTVFVPVAEPAPVPVTQYACPHCKTILVPTIHEGRISYDHGPLPLYDHGPLPLYDHGPLKEACSYGFEVYV